MFLSLGQGGSTYAQEKTKYEKQNERKNKSNRRLKRRGDKGRSNKRKLRATKFKSRTRQGEKSYKGDITGRRVKRIKSSRLKSNASYAKPNPYAGRKRKTESSVAKKALSRPRYTSRPSEKAKRVSINPRFSNRPRERAWKGNSSGRAINTRSKRITFTGKKSYQGGRFQSASRPSERRIKSTRVSPRSASGNYNVRKRKTPYNAFRRQKGWEKAFKGDITGRTFRTKRTEGRPGVKKQPQPKYSSKGRKGDRPYSGGFGGGFKSATRKPERAWKKDISGNKLRIRTSKRPKFKGAQFSIYPQGNKRRNDKAYKGKIKGGGYKSISSRKEIAGKKTSGSEPPGAGTAKGFKFQGNIKTKKPKKGGGSISAKLRNNNGRAIQGRGTTGQDIKSAKFQGGIKYNKPKKGGGSVARNNWNNRGSSITKVSNNKQDKSIKAFQGNVKTGKPLKGGGSVARNNWNNKGKSTTQPNNSEQSRLTRSFQGNIKSGKPLKGGGSVARNNWNNKGKSISKPSQTLEGRRALSFQGNIKSKKYDKNPAASNNSLKVKIFKNKKEVANYQGNTKRTKYTGGAYDALSGTYKGDIKRKSKYQKNPNAAKESLKVKQALKNDKQTGKYQGFVKGSSNYKKNPASANEALKVKAPKKNYFKSGNFDGRTKVMWSVKQNPNSSKESLKNIVPSKETNKGSQFQGRTKVTWSVKRNPNSSKESLKNIAPSKATAKGSRFEGRYKIVGSYARKPHAVKDALKGVGPSRAAIKAADYQGNIKMSKKSMADRHPSYRYSRNNNSSTAEKQKLFSFKLLFAKWFKKNEGQPDNVKQKERRPRFDKKERDIWYE
ncbi:hypothetical protein [Fulvivirga lutimaris]|uniref:hypothetical protein n=1 Tax=Fulvivirga lutimaris TaxID=1819566 RepID=UPI0012BD2F5F|nr:hypothetical protein [Fulvivirga lutimaris]MTI41786.1 hypothetical protein [Fulvivirga lutimaris]